ncbi:hypothetical protein TPHV1_50118 [Treponema phagedenis]|uniref:Uncharacterized protein n=1 Tax=Treponema phagedenis TaxID=162 RepID=A0A0B7GWG1_TREPH|nr:hypothetical protein TPHV1_50118 [Treponema phagedenis]
MSKKKYLLLIFHVKTKPMSLKTSIYRSVVVFKLTFVWNHITVSYLQNLILILKIAFNVSYEYSIFFNS